MKEIKMILCCLHLKEMVVAIRAGLTCTELKGKGRGKAFCAGTESSSTTNLDVLHQLQFLHVHQLALRALEDPHRQPVGVLLEMLLQKPLLVEDRLTGTFVDHPGGTEEKKPPKTVSHRRKVRGKRMTPILGKCSGTRNVFSHHYHKICYLKAHEESCWIRLTVLLVQHLNRAWGDNGPPLLTAPPAYDKRPFLPLNSEAPFQ